MSTDGRADPALLTDLYQLTMLQAYVEEGMHAEAVFSLFVRRLPATRNFLLACGLDDVLTYLEGLRFEAASLECLASLGRFSDRFLRFLEEIRFTGSVDAVAEGTPIFANEPILEITAPIAEAQLVETFIMNQIHLQTVLASKAARVVQAARGRPVVDFGLRRAHGIDAGTKAARAFSIAGVASTSNVAAGCRYGVPLAGTMAHSYVQAHDDELEAFRRFARVFPDTVLLVDTYDPLAGVRKVVQLARELGPEFRVRGIRLDSGDLVALSCAARAILDEAGLRSVQIFASGGLDEEKIEEILAAGAAIDAFGVGTEMAASADAPTLEIAYKLVSYAGVERTKLSSGKTVLPGAKQVFRLERDGRAVGDRLGRRDEPESGRPLLEPVTKDGARLPRGRVSLDEARRRAAEELAKLPPHLLALTPAQPPYPVEVTPALAAAGQRVQSRVVS